MAAIRSSLLAALSYAVLAVWSTYPLVWQLDSVVPGMSAGDNFAALWNTWWFTEAMRGHQSVFWTDALLAPLGTQLSLHTHNLTHSAVASLLWTVTSLPAAHNVAILIALMLNGLVTFWLARRLGCDPLPSFVAGWLFAASPFVQLRLLGHINLLHAWVIPLFLLSLRDVTVAPALGRALILGGSAALVVYTDYYFAVYCGILLLLLAALMLMRPSLEPSGTRWRTSATALLTLAVLCFALAVVIGVTGGTVVEFGSQRISLRGARNPMALGAVMGLSGLYCLFPWRLRWTSVQFEPTPWPGPAVAAFITAAALASPLAIAIVDVIRSGDYATPNVLWRSSPPGGDLATTLLGHPTHVITGHLTQRAYAALGIDSMEQALWIGLVPILLIIRWRRSVTWSQEARMCLIVALAFAVLSLGPFLRLAGTDTGILLPQSVLRYVPGLANARMPGRAVVVVQLSVALLLAITWTQRRPASLVGMSLAALILIESLPGPSALQRLPAADDVDRALVGSREEGGVIELPTGLRDGLGEVGRFDHRALVHQMAHRRPLAGGFVARLSPRALSYHRSDPFFSRLFELSGAESARVALPANFSGEAVKHGFRFLVINRDRVGEDQLSRKAIEDAGLRFVVSDGSRELFEFAQAKGQP